MSEQAMTAMRKTDLLEALAALEHEQWKSWALEILDTELINPTFKRNKWGRFTCGST